MLEVELDALLGYGMNKKNDNKNVRNGFSEKILQYYMEIKSIGFQRERYFGLNLWLSPTGWIMLMPIRNQGYCTNQVLIICEKRV